MPDQSSSKPPAQATRLCAQAISLRARSAATRRHAHALRTRAQQVREQCRTRADVRPSETASVLDERAGGALGPNLGRIPTDEHERFLGLVRDAVKTALSGDPRNGLAMLDLGLAWAETGLDDPWLEDLILCYRTAIHLFCDRFLSPLVEAEARVYHSAELGDR